MLKAQMPKFTVWSLDQMSPCLHAQSGSLANSHGTTL